MQKAETLKIFRPNFTTEEVKFLLHLCREEEHRLKPERRKLVHELRDVRKKLAIMEAKGRTKAGVTYVLNYARVPEKVVLEHDYDAYLNLESKLIDETYLVRQRLDVVEGFIKRFNLLLDGRRTRGGRLNFLACEARRILDDPSTLDLMIEHSTREDDSQ